LNPALYQIVDNRAKYASDVNDVTVGSNQASSIPGDSASTGWDAVTELATPNVANLTPALIAATKEEKPGRAAPRPRHPESAGSIPVTRSRWCHPPASAGGPSLQMCALLTTCVWP